MKLIQLNLPIPSGNDDRKRWDISSISIRSLAIAQAQKQHKGPTIVVASNGDQVSEYMQALPFFVGDKDISIIEFPDWETLPYDSFSPNPEIVSSRLQTLVSLTTVSKLIVVLALPTALHKMVPPEYLLSRSFSISINQHLPRDSLRQQLVESGYVKVSNVYSPGEFSVRGSLIDFFPMGQNQPVRIDFFGDEISEIRHFDINSQCSVASVDSLQLLPASEVPQNDEELRKLFLHRWGQLFSGDSRQSSVFNDVKAGLFPAGIEYYLSLYFEKMSSFFEYLPKNALVIAEHDLASAAENYWKEINNRYENLRYDRHRPILDPVEIFFRVEEIMPLLKQQKLVQIQPTKEKKTLVECVLPDVNIDSRQKNPLAKFAIFLQSCTDPVLICCDGPGRREIIIDLFADQNIDFFLCDSWQIFVTNRPKVGICITPLIDGFWIQENCVVLTENNLYGEHPARQISHEQQKNSDYIIRNLVELRKGNPVVHYNHGIGLYKGLEIISLHDHEQEFMVLEYASADKLYVPITDLHCISRYQGSQWDQLVLDKLGSDQWQKKKKRAQKKARDAAIELLEIQAHRESQKGVRFADPDKDYHTFCSQFSFVETKDQTRAIQEVIADMCSTKSMDRLICGDVGFGKTEVAMRAAFLASYSGKQVALLAPTTLLAQQHYNSFKDRFSSWPVKIEMISRFRNAKDISRIWQLVEDGAIDIVIGTHALFSRNAKISNLGLLIIDEEHRFGVRQKEHFKKLRSQVDILTLTATPIPRTLNFSLSGLRDLTIIATAPSNRLAIKTFILQNKNNIIREAVLRELIRGGQVFILYNQVRTINNRREELQQLLPEARIGVAHGQMPKRELEKTMSQFYHRQFNLLLCTTIIETGIDIPSANTIIIERADKFGLAQLHQLRGRVGRSHHQAYAYLLVPEYLSSEAKQRLDAIGTTNTLGAGFTLAMHDMEIRGAGELLGEGQSGEMEKVGFELYLAMLEEAVLSVRKGDITQNIEPREMTIDFGASAFIPETYLPDVHSRLLLYRRIVGAKNNDSLSNLRVEVIDRYGVIPEELNNLFTITRLQNQARKLHITAMQFSENKGQLTFAQSTPVHPATIIQLMQREPQTYKLVSGKKLHINRQTKTLESRFYLAETILAILASDKILEKQHSKQVSN